ncbi:asparaginase [Solibacillus sp. R5-41]|uniref:asparaginase n=1 Tax=Solibacillus sp. R5-41 TaxID=2048654 RepID=UPI000C12955D|nr:asparaginase [Solibacillus sp. R5-41]ATP41105.1 asparaginase [Solibacillus sp. R5-41]
MSFQTFLKEYRGGVLENIHIGQLSCINEAKVEIYSIGQNHEPVYFRSAAKPFQAIPIFLTGAIQKWGITSEESALIMASQRGEIYHQERLQSLLEKLPFKEEQLICAASYPLNEGAKEQYIHEGHQKRKLYHNCAGKHLGFLTACLANGYPLDNYCDIEHPLQQQIKNCIMELSEVVEEQLIIGVDGCGAPNFAIPLRNMAIAYLKLATPNLIENEKLRSAVIQIVDVMNSYPNMIASENFICSALLMDPNIVAKGGAQGVYCFSLKKEKLSFVFKIMNGSESPWPLVIANLLEQIDYANKETIENVKAIHSTHIKNDAGDVVGEIVSSIQLVT